jgi:hypothetical protein
MVEFQKKSKNKIYEFCVEVAIVECFFLKRSKEILELSKQSVTQKWCFKNTFKRMLG